MVTIDKRKTYILFLDTETANGLEDPLVYNIGFSLQDSNGIEYERGSYVIRDIFIKENDLMNTCYYANKLPWYWEQLAVGSMQMKWFREVKKEIRELIQSYDCVICAHNARFDVNALNTTLRYLTNSKQRYFLPYGVEVWDTMAVARSVIGAMPTYRKFCEANGYTYGKRNNQLRMTAEVLYRFIAKDEDFNEAHTALEDVLIESEIFQYAKRQHKPMKKVLYAKRIE